MGEDCLFACLFVWFGYVFQAVTAPILRGVELTEMTEFTVSTQGFSFEWESRGLKLHIPKESLPADMKEARVNIKTTPYGQFQLPEDSHLLSSIFWIFSPCKFTKPVTLEIKHCAFSEDETIISDLSFVSAKCSQKDLPYRFIKVDGGVFSIHSSYGSIELSHFSGYGVTGRKEIPRMYCVHSYYIKKQKCEWRFYVVITRDLAVQNAVSY